MQGYMLTIPNNPFEAQPGGLKFDELTDVPKLETLQGIVGGYIEKVPYLDEIEFKNDGVDTHGWVPCVAYCNEEGKLKGMEPNVVATFMWAESQKRAGVSINDALVGNVVILLGDSAFMRAL